MKITMKDKEKLKYNAIAEVCANWWVEVIKNPKFDAGNDSMAIIVSGMMASSLVQPVDDLQASTFKEYLKEVIMTVLVDDDCILLSCDYGPSDILEKVTQAANISLKNFPWKTHMVIRRDMAKVRYGYTSNYVKIYDERPTEPVLVQEVSSK